MSEEIRGPISQRAARKLQAERDEAREVAQQLWSGEVAGSGYCGCTGCEDYRQTYPWLEARESEVKEA